MKHLSFVFILFFLACSFCEGAVVSPDLQAVLQAALPDQEVPIIINFADQVDVNQMPAVPASGHPGDDKVLRRNAIGTALKDKADKTQGPLRALLQGRGGKNMRPLWITNSIAVTVPVSVISDLMSRPEIESIQLDAVIQASPITPAAVNPPQWNITRINAPTLWSAGIDGTHVVVASLDSGVDINHPDLKYRWRGGSCSAPPDCPSWYDPYNMTTIPYGIPYAGTDTELDLTHAHGTHTMGIMVGGTADPQRSAIGVAPGARWISAKIFDDATGTATSSVILQAFQWVLQPAGDAANAPDVVNNSWTAGLQNTCDTTFEAAISNLRAAGIEVVFAAGNVPLPPAAANSSFSPSNNADVFAVGATDNNNAIANFSAWGPSACLDRTTNFPNVVAPGVTISSSVPIGSVSFPKGPHIAYLNFSGTSMAAPHVVGAAALLAEAMPLLTPDQIETAFELSAPQLGSLDPNNTYGFGLLDVAAAYQYAFINFSGKGNVPKIAGVPSSLFFINTTTSGSFTLVIVNQGTADLTINGISFTGTNAADFAITSSSDTCSGQTIGSLLSCSVGITFTPTAGPGPESAQVSIASTDPATPILNVPLGGNNPIARVQDASYFQGLNLVSAQAIVATYAHIQAASNDCSNWDTIQMQAVTLNESPIFNLPLGITVNLKGGYDPAFGTQTGFTTIHGTLTFSKGTVIVRNVIVQ